MATMETPGQKPKPRRRHSEEFKKGAVSLVLDSGKTVIEVARRPGAAAEVMNNAMAETTVISAASAGRPASTHDRRSLGA